MLVLGRKVGEKVFIGNNVCVTVLEVKGDRIRLGFDAGKEIPIHRAEVVQQMNEFQGEPACSDSQPKRRGRSDSRFADCRDIARPQACTV